MPKRGLSAERVAGREHFSQGFLNDIPRPEKMEDDSKHLYHKGLF